MPKQSLALVASAALVIIALAVSYTLIAQAQTNLNSSVSVKKQADTGLFTFSIADSEGIESFNFQPAKSPAYGGGLNCPKKFSNNNVQFIDPDDFDPAMKVTITDCKKNIAEFEIGPLKNGAGKGVLTNKPQEESASPTPSSPKSTESTVAPSPTTQPVAGSKENIQYPVKELGNCADEKTCRSYCDNPDNYSACFAFAKRNGLLEDELADKSEQELESFAQAMKQGGPGGCQTQASCETYCNDISRMNECMAFAEKHQLMKGKELDEARKIQAVLAGGGSLPGGCKNKKECESYCGGPDHAEECLAFAEKAGFLPPEEIKQARKAMELMARGETPGGCKSREQCDAYCGGGEHFEECIAFAEKAGFIPPEELAMIKKTGGKGPGGCKGKAECEAFCQNPDNQESCFEFGKEHGLISEKDQERMKEGKQQFMKALGEAPPEVRECLAQKGITEDQSPRPGMEKHFDECFRSAMGGRGGSGGPGPGGEHNEEFSRQHNEEISSQSIPVEGIGGRHAEERSAQMREEGGFSGDHSMEVSRQRFEHKEDLSRQAQQPGGFPGQGGEHSQERSAQFHNEDVSRQMDAPSMPNGSVGSPPPGGDQLSPMPPQYQQEIQQQYQQQYQQEYQRQYEQQYQQQYQGSPESGSPPPPPPAPSSYNLKGSLVAQVLGLLINLLR